MSNVKLGIRVRPFTDRELKNEKDQIPVVSIVDANTVAIINIKVSVSGAGDSRERVRSYYADYTFDSALPVAHPDYATQEKVFDTIGRQVISSVCRGSPTCVLAYGQSATGKTHTMMGSEADPGLVPRICRALAEVQPFDLTVSFLEIYNERVHDLLAGESAPPTCHSLPRRRGNARKDLRVREHPARGPYVQNLRRVAITDVAALLALVTEGARRRRTAATRRNPTSSRSHALLEIATPITTLHLADLAGSEKAGWEGCGGRQKEGANINKSLVALSNVISALVSGRGRFVPYRDSALTWLLKDCFTGGASTFIIATVSPSVACYGESASTLRWAERARQLPKPRTVVAGRLALQAQYNHLLAELTRNYIRYVPETGKIAYDDNHWKLNINNVKPLSSEKLENTAKIGNIMNLLHPKTDAHSSTASSAASGSSDVINAMDKNIKIDISSEISKEVDKLFGPALERTQSNNDLKVIAPLRHKRRQYKSQETLPIVVKMQRDQAVNVLPSQSEAQINNISSKEKPKNTQIPILYDSQRAEIVASVTERLYNKIKKKEEAAASKTESVVDKKIMEPLSELKICTNARQRLMEISQKALRNKRRIGIPAYTQTRKMVTRVRDQGIDVQTDLEMYELKNKHIYSLHRDAATETIPVTPRCKEMAVGSKYGMLLFHDRSTLTEEKKVIYKSSFVMTDIVTKCDRTTQTQIVPPPRRKRRAVCQCMQKLDRSKGSLESVAPVISINISQVYPEDSESQTSDDNSENTIDNNNCSKSESVSMTPDLLTNHSTLEPSCSKSITIENHSQVYSINENQEIEIANKLIDTNISSKSLRNGDDDFSDTEDCELPRVSVKCLNRGDSNDIKDIILGRNENMYPYNLILSPPRAVDSTKKLVKFEDDAIPSSSVASQTSWETQNKSTNCEMNPNPKPIDDTDKEASKSCQESPVIFSDSTESSKAESDSFIWKKGGACNMSNFRNKPSLDQTYTPICKGAKYAKAKAKLYRQFIGLDEDDDYSGGSSQTSSKNNVSTSDSRDSRGVSNLSFRRRKNDLEDTLKFKCNQSDSFRCLEQELVNSCSSLETSVNKYERYLYGYHNVKKSGHHRSEKSTRTPTEYLQHLVQLRRQVVKGDFDTDSSFGNFQNK